MRTADEFIDVIAAQNQIPCLLFNIPDLDMALVSEWVNFLACAEMSGTVRDDCLNEPQDYYGRNGSIEAFTADMLIQTGKRPTDLKFVDRTEIGYITELDEIAKLDSLNKMWVHWKKLADMVIPEWYDMRDAAECVNLFDPQSLGSRELLKHIYDRMDYLSDRLDPARAYNLDMSIRFALGLGLRD